MLRSIHPKLPMRNKHVTREYYLKQLGFEDMGRIDYYAYLIVAKDGVELHFFEYKDLDTKQNYGQVYIRTTGIEELYRRFAENGVKIHPQGHLTVKPWGQTEFSLLDPDNNLLTFGESV